MSKSEIIKDLAKKQGLPVNEIKVSEVPSAIMFRDELSDFFGQIKEVSAKRVLHKILDE